MPQTKSTNERKPTIAITIKIDAQTRDQLVQLSSKKGISISEVIRRLIWSGLEKDLAKESVDYIREQIHEELKSTLSPMIERIVKLMVKIGYATIPSFYFLSYIMDSLLPDSRKKPIDKMKNQAKIATAYYLKLKGEDWEDFLMNEEKAIEKYDLK